MAFIEDRGAGGITITPATGQIEGGSSFALSTGIPAIIFSDGSNYHVFAYNPATGTITINGVPCTVGSSCMIPQPACSNVNSYVCLNITDQDIAGGAVVTSLSLGTISSGTVTLDCGGRPQQYLTNNGAFTLAAPGSDSSCLLTTTNGASAGTITFSGFLVGTNTGDALDTVNTHSFTLFIWRTNAIAGYRVAAHQ